MMDQMHKEWVAWRQVCRHLERAGVKINDNDAIACAIRMWGEELVALREQNPEHTVNARKERRDEYEKHWLEPRES